MCYEEMEHSKLKELEYRERTRLINGEILCSLFWLKKKMSEEK